MAYWLYPRTWVGAFIGWTFAGFAFIMFPLAVVVSRMANWARKLIEGPVVIEDRVIVIIGGSSGIGRCLAIEYSKRGARLVLCARREGPLREVAQECKDFGAKEVAICAANVTREEDCRRMISFTVATFGRLDVLVNDTDTTHSKLFEDYKNTTEFRRMPTEIVQEQDLDMRGTFYTTKYAIEHLGRTRGQIVLTSSVGAFIPYPYLSLQNALKAGIVSFFDTLRTEPIGDKVTITIAFHGLVDSDITDNDLQGKVPKWWPVLKTELAATAIVEAAVDRKRYVVVPSWYTSMLFYRLFAQELLIWIPQVFLLRKPAHEIVWVMMSDMLASIFGEKMVNKACQALHFSEEGDDL